MRSLPASTRDRLILLSAGAGLLQRSVQLLTALVTLPVALHVLGVAGFGVWGAAVSLAWLAPLLDLGLGSALVTLVPRALAAEDYAQARAHMRAALLAAAGVSLCILLAITLAAGLGGTLPFIIAGAGLAFNIPLGLAQNIWFGLQKGYVAGAWDLAQTVLALAAVLAAAAAGGGVACLVAAIYAATIIANAGSMIHLFIRHPDLLPARAPGIGLRAVMAPGALLFGIGACAASAYGFDNILALRWLGPAAAAQMAVALRIVTTAGAFLTAITQPLWPAFVDAAARDDRAWEWRTLRRGTAAVLAAAVTGAALLLGFGQAAMLLWLQRDLHLGAGMFWAMAGSIIVLAAPRVAAQLLNAVSVLRFQLAVTALAAALALAMKLLFARHFGVAGIIAATPCAWAVIVCPCYAWRVRRWVARRV